MNMISNQLALHRFGRTSDCSIVHLFTNARDESNIAEWVAHHLLLGFDHVTVFDHLSVVPIASVLAAQLPTHLLKQVQIIPVQGSGNIKLGLMKRACQMAVRDHASWMLYLDCDEYLCVNKWFSNDKDSNKDNKQPDIHSYLSAFSAADMVGVNWLMFGSSHHVDQPEGLLTEHFDHSEMCLDQHVKSFVRPECVKSISNPHYYNIFDANRCYSGSMIGKMNMGPFHPPATRVPFIHAIAYIAHYFVQSEQEYRRRKGRAMDDGTPNKMGLETTLHSMYNQVVNRQLACKYSHAIKEALTVTPG